MIYIFAPNFHRAEWFVNTNNLHGAHFRAFSTLRSMEGLRFIPGDDAIIVLPGISDELKDGIRRNAIHSGFEWSIR